MEIVISIDQQVLYVVDQSGQCLQQFSVSTALAGTGNKNGSGCTPVGRHRVRAKIGDGLAETAVFVGRRPTGEYYTNELALQFPERDWILSRILWLQGCESGVNRGGDVDSMRRFIYIHGTPDSEPMGEARSHGCIRMRNSEVIELFNRVPMNCPVMIQLAPFHPKSGHQVV